MNISLLTSPYFNVEPIRFAVYRVCNRLKINVNEVQLKPREIESLAKRGQLDMFDIALVPTAVMLRYDLQNSMKISNVCIACRGPVRSVAVFYREWIDIHSVDEVSVTGESTVSVLILQYLLKQLYARQIRLVPITLCSLEDVHRCVSERPCLLIGDYALYASQYYTTLLDIGEAWSQIHPETPLVFAILLYRNVSEIREIMHQVENIILNLNMREVYEWSSHWIKRHVLESVLVDYLEKNVHYVLNQEEICKFLDKLSLILNNVYS